MMRSQWIGTAAIVSMAAGCWSPCGEPFSLRCKVEAEQCFEPLPSACGADWEQLSYLESEALIQQVIAEGETCQAVQFGMCPDGLHYVQAVQSEEARSVTVFDATTGECVGSTLDGHHDYAPDSICQKPYQVWTGPRELWDSCAKAAYDVVGERRDDGCKPLDCTQETDYCVVIEE